MGQDQSKVGSIFLVVLDEFCARLDFVTLDILSVVFFSSFPWCSEIWV